jgi:hypothetical protein
MRHIIRITERQERILKNFIMHENDDKDADSIPEYIGLDKVGTNGTVNKKLQKNNTSDNRSKMSTPSYGWDLRRY